MVVGNWDALYKVIDQEHNADGTHDTTLPYYNNSIARQAIINGGFTVNQRGYASNATLSAGVYGHDRWKAGASGGDYTFTQLASSTQITIKSGKSLIQVIEDKNVVGGTYTLSWEGTAQARFGKDSATPSGIYASSPITITGQSAGTVMSVEFNEGTLGKVQLNTGSVALPFMAKSFDEELRACQRYCFSIITINNEECVGIGFAATSDICFISVQLPVFMRGELILTATAADWYLANGSSMFNLSSLSIQPHMNSLRNVVLRVAASGLTQFAPYLLTSNNNTGKKLILSSEL